MIQTWSNQYNHPPKVLPALAYRIWSPLSPEKSNWLTWMKRAINTYIVPERDHSVRRRWMSTISIIAWSINYLEKSITALTALPGTSYTIARLRQNSHRCPGSCKLEGSSRSKKKILRVNKSRWRERHLIVPFTANGQTPEPIIWTTPWFSLWVILANIKAWGKMLPPDTTRLLRYVRQAGLHEMTPFNPTWRSRARHMSAGINLCSQP